MTPGLFDSGGTRLITRSSMLKSRLWTKKSLVPDDSVEPPDMLLDVWTVEGAVEEPALNMSSGELNASIPVSKGCCSPGDQTTVLSSSNWTSIVRSSAPEPLAITGSWEVVVSAALVAGLLCNLLFALMPGTLPVLDSA